jgi:hypothetical protein
MARQASLAETRSFTRFTSTKIQMLTQQCDSRGKARLFCGLNSVFPLASMRELDMLAPTMRYYYFSILVLTPAAAA